ncbi:hypothetical protein [Caulobacter segnis]|uniref:hypothetical protein n=1 Tax=Caulobacter segnis TaxID=88688 RepID=UPI001CBE0E87|nr:hypothetical protein [Caulobacter segnis]UAL12187.1 hypothetical protein K8940_07880 [Caulobacter segnis]
MKTLAHNGHPAAPGDGAGGVWAALLVLIVLGLAVWGAWRLGVMAGDKVDLREGLANMPSVLRQAPNPQPMPIPTQRRPAVAAERR